MFGSTARWPQNDVTGAVITYFNFIVFSFNVFWAPSVSDDNVNSSKTNGGQVRDHQYPQFSGSANLSRAVADGGNPQGGRLPGLRASSSSSTENAAVLNTPAGRESTAAWSVHSDLLEPDASCPLEQAKHPTSMEERGAGVISSRPQVTQGASDSHHFDGEMGKTYVYIHISTYRHIQTHTYT